MTSSMSSTASSNISLTSSNFNDKPPIHSKSTQNSTPNNSNKSVRRARSYRRTCSLRNIGAGQMVSARSSSNERLVKKPFFNASVDEIALKPTSQKSRAITMIVKRLTFILGRFGCFCLLLMTSCRSAYGRRGWIVSPTEPGIELNQLKLNGTLDQLIHEIKVLELSGKEVPCRMTVRVQN